MYSELREFGPVHVVRWAAKNKDDFIEGHKIVLEEPWIWLTHGVVTQGKMKSVWYTEDNELIEGLGWEVEAPDCSYAQEYMGRTGILKNKVYSVGEDLLVVWCVTSNWIRLWPRSLTAGNHTFVNFEFLFLGKGEIEFHGEKMAPGDVIETEPGDIVSVPNGAVAYSFYEDTGEWAALQSEWRQRNMMKAGKSSQELFMPGE